MLRYVPLHDGLIEAHITRLLVDQIRSSFFLYSRLINGYQIKLHGKRVHESQNELSVWDTTSPTIRYEITVESGGLQVVQAQTLTTVP